ncbi:hypothetical protein [Microbulbifer sediminum]|uniref:hypothetical protein n=1 Tax=Microbulbifer sediminum TaxID=2904250 RepID=UPI001F279E5A|nr:hypothetical protein [Microbulbifer sediminum]
MKPTKKLPIWVPPAIRTHYQRITHGNDGTTWKSGPYGGGCGLLLEYNHPKEKLEPVITKLCRDPEMESVWRRLERSYGDPRGVRKGWDDGVFRCVLWALFGRSPWDKFAKDIEERPSEIADKVRELSALLRKYEVDETAWDLMEPCEFEDAIDRHYYTAFTPGYQDSDIDGHREPGLFLCQNPPFISDLLERLGQAITAKKNDYEAAIFLRDKGHGLDYRIFASRMCTHFTKQLGGPRYDIVATLSRVLLGVAVDEGTVRDTIRSAHKDKYPVPER